jgi:RNA polymerase sigma-70 factor (sigma-E family)
MTRDETGVPERQEGVRLLSNPSGDPSAVDPEDFQSFVASRGAHLYRTACLLTGGDTHLAEDLVQETLGRMYVKWGRRRRIENPSGYAQTTLVNTFISMRRRKSSTERPTEYLAETPAAEVDLELRVTLLDALAQLAEVDRAVLVLRFWEDRSVEDTAAQLRMSAGAVRSRCFRALGRVRELLGADFIEFAEN